MSNLFDDLEQVLLRSNGLSERESLDDIGEDFEEKDKILFSVSQSLSLSELDVDYSDFKIMYFLDLRILPQIFHCQELLKAIL